VRRLFALDQNLRQPIGDSLAEHIIETELVPIAHIDEWLSTLDDWEVLAVTGKVLPRRDSPALTRTNKTNEN
jgi:hypothetical protein